MADRVNRGCLQPVGLTPEGKPLPQSIVANINRKRNQWTSNIERPKSNIEWMYSVYLKKIERSETTLRNSAVRDSIFCGSLFNPGHPSDPSNHQKTVPFWGSFIRGVSPAAGRRGGQSNRKRNTSMTNVKCRLTNVECRIKEFFLFYLLKRAERSDSHNSSIVNHHSSFVIPWRSYKASDVRWKKINCSISI